MNLVLPERRALNPAYVVDVDRNIPIKATTEGGTLFVTFLVEGAGYKNPFGWFRFDPASVQTDQPIDPAPPRTSSSMSQASG